MDASCARTECAVQLTNASLLFFLWVGSLFNDLIVCSDLCVAVASCAEDIVICMVCKREMGQKERGRGREKERKRRTERERERERVYMRV